MSRINTVYRSQGRNSTVGNNNNNNNNIDNNEQGIEEFVPHHDHSEAVADTIDQGMKNNTRKNYRSRIVRMLQWFHLHYNDFFNTVSRPITDEEIAGRTVHFHCQEQFGIEFIYPRIQPGMVTAYLAAKKYNEKGKIRSHVDVRKYHDAILFGAKEQGTPMSENYKSVVSTFLVSYLKETKVKSQLGNTDSADSDVLQFDMYKQLCTWAVRDRELFTWTYLVLLWNCMARSASIEPLALHNFKRGSDSIIIKYDNSKADSTGEHVSPKNIYANPYDPYLCSFLALGIWFAHSQDQYTEQTTLFVRKGKKSGSATHRYTEKLNSFMDKYQQEVMQWAVPSRIKAHSARKGSATYVTAGTLNPPPASSIAHRGEWSQGRVQDVYFTFGVVGDHYLGRMLAGLDSNSSSFVVLPPHFICGYENKDVCDGIVICFGALVAKCETIVYLKPVLLLLLASIVYHENFILSFVHDDVDHPFGVLPLFRNYSALVQRLKALVTIDPSDNLSKPTGVPTHIKTQLMIKALEEENHQLRGVLEKIEDNLGATVNDAVQRSFEEYDRANGVVSAHVFNEAMANLKEWMQEILPKVGSNMNIINDGTMDADVDDADVYIDQVDNSTRPNQDAFFGTDAGILRFPCYHYNGRFGYHVPELWQFGANPSRRNGWESWLLGIPGISRPFRKFKFGDLPKEIANIWNQQWRPIYCLMEECPDLNIPSRVSNITPEIVELTYNKATEYIKNQRVSFIFNDAKMDYANWTIGTWSRMVRNGNIRKNGSNGDKSRCPSAKNSGRKRAFVELAAGPPLVPACAFAAPTQTPVRRQGSRNRGRGKCVRKKSNRQKAAPGTGGNPLDAFNVNKEFVRQAEEIQDSSDEYEDAIFVQDEPASTSTNPSLIVHHPLQDGSISNTSRMPAAQFRRSLLVASLGADANVRERRHEDEDASALSLAIKESLRDY